MPISAPDPKKRAAPPGFPPHPRAPALQACPSFVPEDALAAFAAVHGTQPSALARVSVSSSACDLWGAITTYLSHSPVPAGSPPVPLHIAKCKRPVNDDAKPRASGYLAELAGTASLKLSTGKTRASQPVFELGTSSIEFVWPPPPHLSAEALIAAETNCAASGAEGQCTGGTCNGGGTTTVVEAKNDAGVEEAATEAPSVIHLFYYSIGEPVAMMHNVEIVREMLLVSPDGHDPLKRFVQEVIEWHVAITSVPDKNARFPLFRFKTERMHNYWKFEGLKRSRPMGSVILAGDQMQTIIDDLSRFKTDEMQAWHYAHGLPYRRSFLFYGPPGTGKTSTVRVLASKFSLSCCVLSVATKNFSNQDLGDALSSLPGNALLVLEDVDALFNLDRTNKTENELTFSGMLNALDGLVSVEGLITVMTTNHIERLERALIRGGRVDRRFRFDLPGREELKTLFQSFFTESDEKTADKFTTEVLARSEGDEARAVSTLQQFFIENKGKAPEECLSQMDTFYNHHFPPEPENNAPSPSSPGPKSNAPSSQPEPESSSPSSSPPEPESNGMNET